MSGFNPRGDEKKVLIAKVAALAIKGIGAQTIARTLAEEGEKITWRNVKSLMATEQFKVYIKELSESVMANAKAELRKEMALLVPEITETIRHHLTERNLMAIPHALKILGVEADEAPKQAQQLVVQLPNIEVPKEVSSAFQRRESEEGVSFTTNEQSSDGSITVSTGGLYDSGVQEGLHDNKHIPDEGGT